MKEIHEKALSNREEIKGFSTEDLIYAPFCLDSGEAVADACKCDVRGERMAYGYFIDGTQPTNPCSRHVVVYEDIFPFLSKISLLRIEERSFPKDVIVVDEKYAYRTRKGKIK